MDGKMDEVTNGQTNSETDRREQSLDNGIDSVSLS